MTERTPIDFTDLAQALLDRADVLVPQWLAGGKQRGHEYVCGDLSGGEGDSCSVNLTTGRWADFSGDDRGGDLISLYAAIHGLNNGQAARQLMQELGWQREPLQASARPPAATEDGRPEPPPDYAKASTVKRKSLWRAIVPVPAGAPAPNFKHWHYTEVERSWEYRFEGQLYGHVVRFRTSDGGKEILPFTWCVDESDDRGTRRWSWKQWEEPRPLYVPATLLSDGGALPVVLVEGEKCAQAGHELLGHEFDFVSWPGGGKAWSKASWGWLMGRTVFMWPDCDAKRFPLTAEERKANVDPQTKAIKPESKQPGMLAMVGIGSMLVADQGCTVLICPVPAPGDVADGWDLADAIAQGWGPEEVRAFIRGARAFIPPDDAARAKAGQAVGEKSARSSAPAQEGEVPTLGWRSHLITSEKGAIKPVRENVVLALDGWPEKGVPGVSEAFGLIAFNEFTNNVDKMRDTPWGTPAGPWLEADELLMGEWLTREYYLPSMSRGTLEEAVLMVATRHAYHPERERVEACRGRWDGVPRLDTWLRQTCLEEDEYDDRDPLQRYLALAGRWFVMAMCARVLPTVKQGARIVRGPGTKFDYMLIFEGPQGWGKSTLATVLGGDYFADTGLVLGEKDSYQNIQGVRVYEWGELENMSKLEVSRVKLFISSPKDRFRASFDRRPRDYPRQVVFVGTTNESHYLSDPTGNRRFWPVRVTRPPDAGWLAQHLDQLFAEALQCLDVGERFWPTREEQRDLFDPQQNLRTVESSIEASIRHYLYDEDQKVPHGSDNGSLRQEIGLGELLTRIGYTIDKQTDVVVKRAGAVMNALGWTVRRTSKPGRPRVYVRPKSNEAAMASAGGSSPLAADETPAETREADAYPF